MGIEQFNPSDPKFKKVEDLPENERKNFINTNEGGFIRKEAAENDMIAEMAALLDDTEVMEKIEGEAREEDKSYEEEKALALESVQNLRKTKVVHPHLDQDYKKALRNVCDNARKFIHEKDFALTVIDLFPELIEEMPDNLLKDREVALKIIDKWPWRFFNDERKILQQNYLKDKEIMLAFIVKCANNPEVYIRRLKDEFPAFFKEYNNDPEVMLALIKTGPPKDEILECLGDELRPRVEKMLKK